MARWQDQGGKDKEERKKEQKVQIYYLIQCFQKIILQIYRDLHLIYYKKKLIC